MASEREREYKRTSYAWYKEHGICPTCKARDAMPGRVMCAGCTCKAAVRQAKKRPGEEARKRHTEAQRARRAQRRAEGLCTACGKPAWRGHALCYECNLWNNRRQREFRAKRRAALPAQPKRKVAPPEVQAWGGRHPWQRANEVIFRRRRKMEEGEDD